MPINLKKSSLKYKDHEGNMQDLGLPVGGIITDITLTKLGVSADAKATGEKISNLEETISNLTLGVHTDGLVYIFVNGNPVGNGLNISGGTVEPDTPSAKDNIILEDGVMTILGLAKEPTLTESILTIV